MQGETRISANALAPLIAERAHNNERLMVAIAGPPAAGKSRLARRLVEALNSGAEHAAIVVPMDGFHYDDSVLKARGLLPRKGAPETFDVDGFAVMLERLATATSDVAIPLFDRDLEISRAGAAIVTPEHRILIVEGNYLLLDEPGWDDLGRFFGLTAAIAVPFEELERRLVRRWLKYGMNEEDARARALSNDIPNAKRVLAHARPADYVLHQDDAPS